MPVRVAINGFGRVGRCALRSAFESGAEIDCVGINDVADPATLAHLLRHDSVYGPFPGDVAVDGDALVLEDVRIPVHAIADPAELPWAEAGVDVVLECTGKFRKRADAAKHLAAGAAKVIVSAPGKDALDATIVRGVNEAAYDPDRHDVISNASCTTNCLAPVAKVLHETFGIRHGTMTTIHAVTGDQRVVDMPHKDLRRARAASGNIVPTTTGAATAIGLVIPELTGKLRGFAARVPVLTGSLVDLTVELERVVTVEEINVAFELAAAGVLADILSVSYEPLVSSDVIKSPFSSVVDGGLTGVVAGTQAKVVAWYDNEWGYATRLVELAQRIGVRIPVLA
ncbi:MAG TPA: type I glyceraldehyde-3-phosphate dehydrogenase [Gaiellaceae bacterium]|nr:type I glyceraldehyde-3-phosphate dehydrogenase [Gaiellaceae bacterium]